MKSFKRFIEVAIATTKNSNIGNMNNNDNNDDYRDDSNSDFMWDDGGRERLISWIKKDSRCYKHIINDLCNLFFNQNNQYMPSGASYSYDHIKDINSGYIEVLYEWPRVNWFDRTFVNLKNEIAQSLVKCFDLWSAMDISQSNAWTVISDKHSINWFFHYLIKYSHEQISTDAKISAFSAHSNYLNKTMPQKIKERFGLLISKKFNVPVTNNWDIKYKFVNGYCDYTDFSYVRCMALQHFEITRKD